MKKNILAENMRRFGTKNLNEQATNPDCSIDKVVEDLKNGTRWIPGFENAEKQEVKKPSFHGITLTVLGDTVTSSVNDEIFQHKYRLNIFKNDNGRNKWIFGMFVEDTNGNIKFKRQYYENDEKTWICTSDTSTGGIQLGRNGIDITDDLEIRISKESAGNAKNK
jgi:hypothetical protein